MSKIFQVLKISHNSLLPEFCCQNIFPKGICKKQLDYFISLGSKKSFTCTSYWFLIFPFFMCTEIHHFSLHSLSLFELIIISSVLIQNFLTKLSCFLNCTLRASLTWPSLAQAPGAPCTSQQVWMGDQISFFYIDRQLYSVTFSPPYK